MFLAAKNDYDEAHQNKLILFFFLVDFEVKGYLEFIFYRFLKNNSLIADFSPNIILKA